MLSFPAPRPAANDNSPFEAVFEKIPQLFLKFYDEPLFDWAKRLSEGDQLTINLLSPPNATVISSDYEGRVSLRYDAYAHPITKKMRFVIKPLTEEDAERIRKHCERLPAIVAAHKAADQAKRDSRPKQAQWTFDGTVPEYFVLRYQLELREWARNLKKIGTTKHIVLREGSLADMSPDDELGAVLVQVTLKVRVERIQGDELRLVVSAADEEQELRIAKHCEKMERNRIPAGAVLVEPERPFVPFMPKVDP